MLRVLHGDDAQSSNGAPQVAATVFLVLFALMLLLPLLRVSANGAGATSTTLFLFHTDFGFNPFALLLLLVPLAGIAAALLGHALWRIGVAVVAVIGLLLVPLTLLTFDAEHGGARLPVHAVLGVGAYVLILGYLAMIAMALLPILPRARSPRDDTRHIHTA